MHSQGRLKRTEKLIPIKPARKVPAYVGDSSPVVKGLALVLSTCLSISRSVKSLMMQPAARHPSAPIVNSPIVDRGGIHDGDPRAIPQKQGSNRSCVPICFYTLAKRRYGSICWYMVFDSTLSPYLSSTDEKFRETRGVYKLGLLFFYAMQIDALHNRFSIFCGQINKD